MKEGNRLLLLLLLLRLLLLLAVVLCFDVRHVRLSLSLFYSSPLYVCLLPYFCSFSFTCVRLYACDCLCFFFLSFFAHFWLLLLLLFLCFVSFRGKIFTCTSSSNSSFLFEGESFSAFGTFGRAHSHAQTEDRQTHTHTHTEESFFFFR